MIIILSLSSNSPFRFMAIVKIIVSCHSACVLIVLCFFLIVFCIAQLARHTRAPCCEFSQSLHWGGAPRCVCNADNRRCMYVCPLETVGNALYDETVACRQQHIYLSRVSVSGS